MTEHEGEMRAGVIVARAFGSEPTSRVVARQRHKGTAGEDYSPASNVTLTSCNRSYGQDRHSPLPDTVPAHFMGYWR